MFWENKKVLVTGGTGFIGSHLVERLLAHNATVTVLDRVNVKKLRNIESFGKDSIHLLNGDCGSMEDALKATEGQDIVMNLAAHVGGIDYNRKHQGSMLVKNLAIGSTVIEAARRNNVERFLVVSSACVYPHDAYVPTPESEGFRSEPEPTNGGYGWSKRIAELIAKYYVEEFGMNISIVRPYNAYGPRDHFDKERSHVIPSLIHRVFEGENPLSVWGSGNQTRAFLYVEDLVVGLMDAVEKHPFPEPINLGSDEEVSIKDLINIIVEISGKKIQVNFDISKPDGSPRRNSDNTKAKNTITFVAKTTLREGLKKTIDWYLQFNS